MYLCLVSSSHKLTPTFLLYLSHGTSKLKELKLIYLAIMIVFDLRTERRLPPPVIVLITIGLAGDWVFVPASHGILCELYAVAPCQRGSPALPAACLCRLGLAWPAIISLPHSRIVLLWSWKGTNPRFLNRKAGIASFSFDIRGMWYRHEAVDRCERVV